MLKERGVSFDTREYTKDPLSADEIRDVLGLLQLEPRAVLRTRDPAYKALGLADADSDDAIIEAMAAHPGLLQRPIGVFQGRAVVGRPAERLLEII